MIADGIPSRPLFLHALPPIAQGNEITDNTIPQSQIFRPAMTEEQYSKKVEKLLGVFRTSQQQYMLLGFYALGQDMKNVEVLQDLHGHHINLVHKYSSGQSIADAYEDLHAAKNAGIGVLQNLPSDYLKADNDFWRRRAAALAQSQQIKVWYLPEEIAPKDLAHLATISQAVRTADSSRRPIVTYVENYVEGYWERVAELTDAIALGAYPILLPDQPRANGRRMIDKAHEVGVPVVIKAVEAYTHNGRWTQPKEVRFDAYLALISGAKGLLWYCYARASENPSLMAEIYNLATELNGPEKLGQVILAGEAIHDIRCELLQGNKYSPPATAFENRNTKEKRRYATIQWLARRHEGALYIFVVNLNEEIGAPDHGGDVYKISYRFESDLFQSERVQVMHEGRSVGVTKHSFVDTIAPIGTHIYKIPLSSISVP